MSDVKGLIEQAILVAAWRDGDIDTQDGTYATTDTDEMIRLESAIQDVFDGMEANDLICTGRVSDYIEVAMSNDNRISALTETLRLKEEECKQLAQDKDEVKSLLAGVIEEYEGLLNKSIDHVGCHGTSALSQAKLFIEAHK